MATVRTVVRDPDSKKRAILSAARRLLVKKGFQDITMDAVADEAGVAKGTLFLHYKSKEDLFLAVLDDRIERQFVVITDALDTENHAREEQLPRIAAAIHTQMWDDSWSMLFLEFVLYASRNPDVRSKLIAFQRKSRDVIESLIEAAGDAVAKDQPLLILEAMKMQNEIRSPAATARCAKRLFVEAALHEGAAIADQIDRNLASETMAQRLKSLRWRRLNFKSCHIAFASMPSKSWMISSTRTRPCRPIKASSFLAVLSNSSVETRPEISISTATRLSNSL